MTRDENAFDAQINPYSGKIGKRHAPVFLAFVDVRLERKTVDAIPLTEIPFMVLTLVLVRDARVELEKWREEGVRGIAGRGSERRRRNQTGHLLQWNRCCRTVIEENGIRQII